MFSFPDGLQQGWLKTVARAHFVKITKIHCPMPHIAPPLSLYDFQDRMRQEYQQVFAFKDLMSSRGYRTRSHHFGIGDLATVSDFVSPAGVEVRWEASLGGPLADGVEFKKTRGGDAEVEATVNGQGWAGWEA